MQNMGLIVVAAGSGQRMKTETPKPYLLLRGKPLVIHTLQALEKTADFYEKIVVVSADCVDQMENDLLPRWLRNSQWKVVAGGARRQDSVAHGLECLSRNCQSVFIHDGARPFVTSAMVQRLIEKIAQGINAIAAVSVNDTLKRVKAETVDETVSRDRLMAAQTPQAFMMNELCDAFRRMSGQNFVMTDEASLIEHFGGCVEVVPGERCNIKITTPEDFILARGILESWKERNNR